MASLKISETRTIEDVMAFPKGRGYVLDFSDRTIAEFFEDEFGIDFNDPNLVGEGSKRVRLNALLEHVNSQTAVKILRALWDHREGLVMREGKWLNPTEEYATKKPVLKYNSKVRTEYADPFY